MELEDCCFECPAVFSTDTSCISNCPAIQDCFEEFRLLHKTDEETFEYMGCVPDFIEHKRIIKDMAKEMDFIVTYIGNRYYSNICNLKGKKLSDSGFYSPSKSFELVKLEEGSTYRIKTKYKPNISKSNNHYSFRNIVEVENIKTKEFYKMDYKLHRLVIT